MAAPAGRRGSVPARDLGVEDKPISSPAEATCCQTPQMSRLAAEPCRPVTCGIHPDVDGVRAMVHHDVGQLFAAEVAAYAADEAAARGSDWAENRAPGRSL